jgi:malonyl-CoA O-methyltransferase
MTPAAPPAFDRRAGRYDTHATVQREAAAWLAEWLPQTIDGPALELGAGTGLFTRHLATRATQLVATDTAPRMVHHGRAAVPGASWVVNDADQPPDSHPFRWIFSCSLAQWLPDPDQTFRTWHHVAAPDARLLAGWFIRGTLADFFHTCPEAAPFEWKSADQWLPILTGSGWHPVRHEVKTFTRHYANSIAMLRAIHNVGAVIPHRLGSARLRDTLRRHDALHRDGVTADFVFLRLEAVRA